MFRTKTKDQDPEQEPGLERDSTPEELTPVQKMERYRQLLLLDPDGNEREAVSERVLPVPEPGGFTTARAEFSYRDGAYFIDEYRNHGLDPIYTSYMVPVEQWCDPGTAPEGAVWATGMIRHKWMARSIHDFDNIEPVLGVVEVFFDKLPE